MKYSRNISKKEAVIIAIDRGRGKVEVIQVILKPLDQYKVDLIIGRRVVKVEKSNGIITNQDLEYIKESTSKKLT